MYSLRWREMYSYHVFAEVGECTAIMYSLRWGECAAIMYSLRWGECAAIMYSLRWGECYGYAAGYVSYWLAWSTTRGLVSVLHLRVRLGFVYWLAMNVRSSYSQWEPTMTQPLPVVSPMLYHYPFNLTFLGISAQLRKAYQLHIRLKRPLKTYYQTSKLLLHVLQCIPCA